MIFIIFLLNRNKQPLDPVHPATARKLLKNKQAVVHKTVPFTIRLKELVPQETKEYSIKIDPGSKTTGIAIVCKDEVVHLAELEHKTNIPMKMADRKSFRNHRRVRNLRYRPVRYNNRKTTKGWLAPSILARVYGTIHLVKKYQKLIPLTKAYQELVRFDTQKLENPLISGIEYQQGELMGYEIREYLLEKFNRTCFYCEATNVPLEIEHCIPKSRYGTNRVSNLTLACRTCNQEKGNSTPEEWLAQIAKKKNSRHKTIQKNIPKLKKALNANLKDATAVNLTKNKLKSSLEELFEVVHTSSGAVTKMNRVRSRLPKEHFFDAVSVGEDSYQNWHFRTKHVLKIKTKGRGSRYRSRIDKFGFPKLIMPKSKIISGYITGDLIKATVPKGKYKGEHTGYCSMRSAGNGDIKNQQGAVLAAGINAKYFQLIQRFDGYSYKQEKVFFPSSVSPV